MSRRTIRDEFSALKVSRQRKYQLRQAKKGKCTICGEPASTGSARCLKHWVQSRERQRRKRGSKIRYKVCPSYKLEATLTPRGRTRRLQTQPGNP